MIYFIHYSNSSTVHQLFPSHQGTAGGGVGLLSRGVRGAPAWSVLVVAGELRTLKDAQDVRWMCTTLGWPCLCDSLGD